MISCVINWSETLVDEAFDVVDELFNDPGVAPDFLLMIFFVMFFVAFSKRLGYHCYVGHFGITTVASIFSW